MVSTDEPFGRRTAIKKGSLAMVAATGVGAVTNPASAINDGEETSDGDYDDHSFSDYDRGELAIGASVLSNPYTNSPGPVFLNWCAGVNDNYARMEIRDLEMTVDVLDYSSGDDRWYFSNSTYSIDSAPEYSGYEPSFSVSIGYIVGFGVGFSTGGTADDPHTRESKTVSHDFGTVASSSLHETSADGNSGWLWVDVHNPNYDELDDPQCVLSVDASCTYYWKTSCPGPGCYGEEQDLSCSEIVTVDFDN